MSDIAEIRGGMASHGFSQLVDCAEKHRSVGREQPDGGASCPSCVPLHTLRAEKCLSIVAYERTLDLQLLGEDQAQDPALCRDWFVDILSLLAIKSIMSSHTPDGGYAGKESVLRLRHWRRVKTNSSYVIKSSRSNSVSTSTSSNNMLGMLESDFGEVTLAGIGGAVPPLCQYPPPNCTLPARRLEEAQLFLEILCESIEIEEERGEGPQLHLHHSLHSGLIECNTLWLDPALMRIYVMPTREEEELSGSGANQVRGTNLSAIRVSHSRISAHAI